MLKTLSIALWAVRLALGADVLAGELSPVGLWKTIDDKTGKPRGVVRIYEVNGELFGKIVSTFDPAEAKQVCGLCTGDRKDKPVIGMVILRHMKKHDAEYAGGDIMDPDTGSVYRCKLRLGDNGAKLELRGFIGFSLLGRTQIWSRHE